MNITVKAFSDAVGLDLGAEWQVGINDAENIPDRILFLYAQKSKSCAEACIRHCFGLQDPAAPSLLFLNSECEMSLSAGIRTCQYLLIMFLVSDGLIGWIVLHLLQVFTASRNLWAGSWPCGGGVRGKILSLHRL